MHADAGPARSYIRRGGDYSGCDQVAVIRLLLKDGRVPVDARDSHGRTALWWACLWDEKERARVLLLEGWADPTIRDKPGRVLRVVLRKMQRRKRRYWWSLFTDLLTYAQEPWRLSTHARQTDYCTHLLEWYEDTLLKAEALSRARAVMVVPMTINKAPEKMRVKTEAEAQKAREEAAPAYLRGRVGRGEALPAVKVVQVEGQEEQEETGAVFEYVMKWMTEDLYVSGDDERAGDSVQAEANLAAEKEVKKGARHSVR